MALHAETVRFSFDPVLGKSEELEVLKVLSSFLDCEKRVYDIFAEMGLKSLEDPDQLPRA